MDYESGFATVISPLRYPPTNLRPRFSSQGIADACGTRFRYARGTTRAAHQFSSFKVIERLIVSETFPISICRGCTPRRSDLTAKQHRLPAINRALSGFFHPGTQPRFMAGLHPASLTVLIESLGRGHRIDTATLIKSLLSS